MTTTTMTSSDDTSNVQDQQTQTLHTQQQQLIVHQLEYYFSNKNLSHDTYLKTLRSLNDGCVPLSILCGFGKIQLLTRDCMTNMKVQMQRIMEAIQTHSKHLRVYEIDAQTGRRIVNAAASAEDESRVTDARNDNGTETISSPKKTILAVGTHDGEPIPDDDLLDSSSPSPLDSTPSPSFSNTLILRDVDPSVSAQDIFNLYKNEISDGPPILDIHPDVANCWYIVLDTSEREECMSVMMQLRSCTLAGQYVQARLKASVPPSAVLDPAAPVVPLYDYYAHMYMSMMPVEMQKQQRRRKRNKKKHQQKKKNQSNGSGTMTKSTSKKQPPAPPSLGEDDFPILPHENKVEWEVTPPEAIIEHNKDDSAATLDEEENGEESMSMSASGEGTFSSKSSVSKGSEADAASTATTVSSSIDSSSLCRNKTLGGYAAALLKPSPSAGAVTSSGISHSAKKNIDCKGQKMAAENHCGPTKTTTMKATLPATPPCTTARKLQLPLLAMPSPILVEPPSWGQGRSFADVMRSC